MVKYGAFDREIKKYPENPSVGTDQPAQTAHADPHGWTDLQGSIHSSITHE